MAELRHEPEAVYDAADPWHVCTPAEVCAACSDGERGVWVPASFCPAAKAKMPLNGSTPFVPGRDEGIAP